MSANGSGAVDFYGWRLLAVFWLILMLASAMPLYAGGVLNAYMVGEFGVDRDTLSLPMSILQFVFGIGALLVARIVNRIGVRLTLTLGGFLAFLGAVVMALGVRDILQATLAFGFVVGAGFCVAGGIPTQVGVTRWFLRRRALALAILFSAPGVGGFLAAPAMNRFVVLLGGDWRAGWWVAAAAGIGIMLLAVLFVRENPADVGQEVDGGPAPSSGERMRADTEGRPFVTMDRWSSREVLRNATFWLMLLAGLGVNIGFTLYLAVGIVHLQDAGFTATDGAWALSRFAISALIAKIILGALGDRLDPRYIWAFMLACYGFGAFLVAGVDADTSLAVYPIAMGIGYGGHIACMMAVLSNYYGREAFPAVAGVAVAVTTCAGALAPMSAGSFYDAFGSYGPAFTSLASWCLAGTIAMLALRRPGREC